MSLFLQVVYYTSVFHSEEAAELAGWLPFKEKLLYPPAGGMKCYLEVSLCWHSRFGTDDSKGRIQLHGGRCSIPSFLCTTASKPCLEETFIFHTRTGDPFVTKLGSCCHGNAERWIPHTCFPQCRFL